MTVRATLERLQSSLGILTMASGFSPAPRKEGTWTKLVIFAAIYCLILESILQMVLVLYLYGNATVDSKMTTSLILALVSVCSINRSLYPPITDSTAVDSFDPIDLTPEPGRLAIQQHWRIWRTENGIAQCLHLRVEARSYDVARSQCLRSGGCRPASVLST